jgi:biopolymer transport protein ExbD
MDGNGDVLFNNTIQDISRVKRELALAVSTNPNLAVILTIDPRSPWQNVVSFVELAQDLKIDSFSFVMKKEADR